MITGDAPAADIMMRAKAIDKAMQKFQNFGRNAKYRTDDDFKDGNAGQSDEDSRSENTAENNDNLLSDRPRRLPTLYQEDAYPSDTAARLTFSFPT
ncbi:hypothetical protein EPUL_002952 [Erysiphe pulchra]|uniref:Uncharacterized protein n=1 Tax=Erysiphe pulchra TaxID=225359 RepID=A0A2S4PVQ8_9PEZI|nr:hypothetical protein EPUL_002952 [Erysiphe pulchra]